MPKKPVITEEDRKQNKVIAKIKKQIGSNWGYKDTAIAGQLIKGWSGMVANVGITHLSGLVVGDAYNNRTGNIAEFEFFKLKLWVQANTAGAAGDNFFPFRVMLVEDKQANAAAPPAAALFQESSSNNAIFFSQLNLDYLGTRFRVMYDKTHVINDQALNTSAAPATISKSAKVITIKKKINTTTKYIAGTTDGTISNVAKNSLYLFIFSPIDDQVAINASMNISFYA